MPNGSALPSCGSITGSCSAAWLPAVGPPSTDSGPRIAESRCGVFGKLSSDALPGGTVYFGSATTPIATGWYQFDGVNVTCAAHWVRVRVSVIVPDAPSTAASAALSVTVRMSTFVDVLPVSAWIFSITAEAPILKI